MKSQRSSLQLKSKGRTEGGSSTPLVIACSGTLAVTLFAVFQFSLMFAGSRETMNAVDAGALNVAKQIFEFKTSAQDQDEKQYSELVDSQGQFSLTNINRVWGKALLASLNVDAMNQEGTGSGEASSHNDQLYAAAQRLSDRLADQVGKSSNLCPSFNAASQQNTVNMLGRGSTAVAQDGTGWGVSMCDRGTESNITITQEQLPGNSDPQTVGFVNASDGTSCIPGYNEMKVCNHSYYLVPFKVGETPHLISKNVFDANSTPLANWNKPLPNSWSAVGVSTNQGRGLKSASCVQTNPQRKFNLEMPSAFVKINLKSNRAMFQTNEENETEESVGWYPWLYVEGPYDAGVGTITAYCFTGLEYIPPTVYQAIYALPGDHSDVSRRMLQRCREIKQNTTSDEVVSALKNCILIPGITDYYLFRKGDKIVCSSIGPAGIGGMFGFSNEPDGSGTVAAEEFTAMFPNPTFNILAGGGQPIYLCMLSLEYGTETWTPGSGYNGCLGRLDIERETDFFNFGTVIPTP